MWIYMLVVEIPLVLASGSGLKRFGARGLLGVGVIVGGMRWLLSALIHDPQLLALVQTLHGVTVVGLLMGGPLYLDVVTPEKLRSTAQAFLSTVGVGIAGIVSNLGSGWLLDTAGINALYSGAGISSVLLGCLVWWILPAPERPKG
jgi:PPP family 3-phenylpropionic acid transporter